MKTSRDKERQLRAKERDAEKDRDTAIEDVNNPPVKVLFDNRIKRKNVLALNEKVAAIREYEKLPVYKRIGRMFHCSPDQIKRIVHQKNAIMQEWEQRTRRSQDAKTLMKAVRVSMMGKAVYEWIRRMMYYKDFMITDGLIQKMALQFKSAMGLQNFFPHTDWCDKFRNTYQIKVNDSKLLSIAHTQGHSVQIKDIVRDVLSECSPEVPEISEDEDEQELEVEVAPKQTNARKSKDVESNNNSRSSTKQHVVKSEETESKAASSSSAAQTMVNLRMPKLQPLRQLVALPFQTGNGNGLTQKVLVATPIAPMGSQAKGATTPMTMTIIPLTTIAKPATSNVSNDKALVPPPLVEIKREIKTERPDTPQELETPIAVSNIKQECISDDEQNEQSASAANSGPVVVAKPAEKRNAAAGTAVARIANAKSTAKSRRNSEAEANLDDDNVALSSLRKRIRHEASPDKQEFHGFAEADSPCSSREGEEFEAMPPLPPLTKAPTLVNRSGANKRNLNADKPPSLPAIKTCAEARRYLKLLEDFALFRENFRLIGLVTRADEVLRELDGNDDVDID